MKVSTTFTLLVVLVVGWLIVFSTSTGARAGTTTSISQFAGAWEGVYFSYPHPMGLTMTLTQTEEASVEGEVRFYPLRQDSRSVVRAPEGRFSVRGTYDPTLLTFTLEPGAWIERPRQGGKPFVLQGVFDPGQPALAGLHSSQRNDRLYFTLTRPDRGHLLTGPMLDATTKPARHPLAGLFGGPDEGTLVRWASKLTAEYPDVDPRRTELGRLYAMAVNLFEDEHFRAHFGKTFDQLSAGEREAVRTTFAKTSKISTSPRGSFRGMLQGQPNEELRQFSALGRAFSPTGTQGAPDVMHMVLAQRVIRAWRAIQLGRLAQMAPALDAFDELDRLTAATPTHLRTLWPSEQMSFQATVEQTQYRLAGPVLTAIIDELVASAEGVAGARQLAGLLTGTGSATDQAQRDAMIVDQRPQVRSPGRRGPDPGPPPQRVPQLSAMVSADIRAEESSRIQRKIDELVEAEVERDRASVAEFGHGIGALQAGGRWYQQASQKYVALTNHHAVRSLFRELAEQRGSVFPGVESEIASRIRSASSTAAVSDVLTTYLAVPSDRSDPVAGRLLASATERRDVLTRAEAVEEQHRLEVARAAASPCARVPDNDAVPPDGPSSRDVCRAVEAEFLAMQAGMDEIQSRCAGGHARYDRALAMLCGVQGAIQGLGADPGLSLASFEELGCKEAPSAPGYVCSYRASVRSSNPQFGSMFDMFSGGEVITSRFVQTRQREWVRAR